MIVILKNFFKHTAMLVIDQAGKILRQMAAIYGISGIGSHFY
jgi:hypothetical protein